jgi:signal transduction histidine kinase/CheY-like chemotaxis protein
LVIFEYDSGAEGLQLLRDQIESALRYVGLHHKVLQKTKLHERSVQERLAATKRMQSLSVLAGGVAHDLNNALGPLVGLPDIILSELEEVSSAQEALVELRHDVVTIKGAAQRAAQTIKDLLTLGRQGQTTREPLDLHRAVAACLSAASPQLVEASDRRIDVMVDVSDKPIVVKASEAQLARAVTNLVRNAVEAIPGDGQVVVRTRETCIEEPTAGYETIPPGNYAVVSVSDNGEGIPNDRLGWVFEPFASRKRLGERSGTGLGLAIVHSVVKEHEGFVDVSSTVGQGTTFSLYLPCMGTQMRPCRPASAAPRGQAKILIVDDEPIQLRTARRILTHLGYEVDTMTSGMEACRLFARAAAQNQRPYDLVILDMLLNEDKDGLQIFEQIQELFPGQRAIVASGHAPTECVEHAMTHGLAWLAKPYTPEALARAVRSVMATGPNGVLERLWLNAPADS